MEKKARIIMANSAWILIKLLLIGGVALILNCHSSPIYPDNEEFTIYAQTLMQGFDIGIDDSKQKRNWLLDMGEYMRIEYPNGLEWGCVFIVVGMVPFKNIAEDFSKYQSFSIDLRGNESSKKIEITIEDIKGQSHWGETLSDLEKDWKTYKISLKKFEDIDLRKLRVLLNLKVFGSKSQTIDFRNLKYSTIEVEYILPNQLDIIKDGELMRGCAIGCNTSDSLKNWIFKEDTCWKASFPPNQNWATVFLYSHLPLDLLYYDSLCVEIKGTTGGEEIAIGLNDTLGEDPISMSTIKWKFPAIWKRVSFPLSYFKDINLSKIIIPIQFINRERKEKTILVRNVIYSHK